MQPAFIPKPFGLVMADSVKDREAQRLRVVILARRPDQGKPDSSGLQPDARGETDRPRRRVGAVE